MNHHQDEDPPRADTGALCWQVWQSYQEGDGPNYEATLYSDASFEGAFTVSGLGPYTLFNTITKPGPELNAALVVRWSHHPSAGHYEPHGDGVSGDGSWIGLSIDQEFAALLALILGSRVWSGGITREFRPRIDPAGNPVAWLHVPTQWQPARNSVLPDLANKSVHIGDLPKRIANFPKIDAAQSIALVRAARLYQMAVWVADEDPELAWLQLVSCAEVAAHFWYGNKQEPAEALGDAQPELVGVLRQYGGDDLVERAADLLASVVGSTRKFHEFLLTFAPSPPEIRCLETFQVPWASLKKRLGFVYQYRSRRLHSGVTFPSVLCAPPPTGGGEPVRPMEKPPGISHFTSTASWTESQLPMYLWVFEYLVRGAVLRWFNESLGETEV